MDERWIAEVNSASLIVDMTWSGKDSWKDSGGYDQVWAPKHEYEVDEEYTPPTDSDDYGEDDKPDENDTNGGGDPRWEGVDEPKEDGDEEIKEDGDEEIKEDDDSYEDPNPEPPHETDDRGTIEEYYHHYPIHSLHWFSQHNGARQWTIWESQTTRGAIRSDSRLKLKCFDGTLVNSTDYSEHTGKAPWRTLKTYAPEKYPVGSTHVPFKSVDDRIPVEVGITTQSETWGGRLYLVNGYNSPIVFNGEYVEIAGFTTPPPPPTASAAPWDAGNTRVKGHGYPQKDGARSKYGRWRELTYSGMGPRGYSEYAAGSYRAYGGDPGSETPGIYGEGRPEGDSRKMWSDLRNKEQHDNRKVGWQYRVTYVNDRGQESMPSDPSNTVVTHNGSGNKSSGLHGKCMVSVDIPIGPPECVARKIYRTRQLFNSDGDAIERGASAVYYFLHEVQDNMTSTFIDHHPDSSLGSILNENELGNYPIGTKFLATFKNTMFAAGSSANTIHYSAALFPEVFPSRNEIHVGDEDGGEITGIRATKNALIVFKTRGIYLIKGDPSGGFFAHTLNKDVGCVAPASLKEIPGLGMAFLSEKGVMLLEGALENSGTVTAVVDISTTIPNQIERITKATAINAVGVVYLKDKEYWLAVPIDGSRENTRVLVYHYEIGAWSIRDNFPIKCAITTRDHRGYLYFGSNINADSDVPSSEFKTGLCVYSRGFSKKGRTAITPTYSTNHIPFGNYFATVQPCHVMAYCVGMGDNDIQINYEVNRSHNPIRSISQGADQQDPNERFPVYGSAIWGEDEWATHRPTVVRFDVSTASRGPCREFKVTFTSERRRMELIGYDLETKIGEQRNIKALNEALSPDRR
tara:strand:+ start:2551 stop:5124 length:2574 start_codon:yes stop_codon:yes gene_type:complete